MAAVPLRVSSFMRPTSFTRTSQQLRWARCQSRDRWEHSSASRSLQECHGLSERTLPIITRTRAIHTSRNERRTNVSTSPTSNSTPIAQRGTDDRESATAPYEPPRSGLLSVLPSTWIPYAELVRLDKPAGTYYLFLPCLFSTLLAAPHADPITPPSIILTTSALFFAGALIMRGAGCTINDLWDRNLDPHVARTRHRPIARGAISVQQAIPFLGAQLLAGLGVLVSLPSQCFFYATPSLLLVANYPLAKRITNYPQFVLGLTFSWGAIVGFPALGIDLLADNAALLAAGCLYASCVAWTVVYDMVYAYQDIRDDAKAGIKSIALAQEANAKAFLAAVSGLQVTLLAGAGVAIGAGPIFFGGVCGGAGATLGYMIWKVDLRSVADCWAWFRKGAWFTGGAISSGLLGEYFAQYYGWYNPPGGESLSSTPSPLLH